MNKQHIIMNNNIITVKCKLSERETRVWYADLTRQLRANVLEQIHLDLFSYDFYSFRLKAIHTYNSHNQIITFKINTYCDLSGVDLEALTKAIKTGLQGVFYLSDVTLSLK